MQAPHNLEALKAQVAALFQNNGKQNKNGRTGDRPLADLTINPEKHQLATKALRELYREDQEKKSATEKGDKFVIESHQALIATTALAKDYIISQLDSAEHWQKEVITALERGRPINDAATRDRIKGVLENKEGCVFRPSVMNGVIDDLLKGDTLKEETRNDQDSSGKKEKSQNQWQTVMLPLLGLNSEGLPIEGVDPFVKSSPGGSAFNTCATVFRLMNPNATKHDPASGVHAPQSDFYTFFGTGPSGKMIARVFEKLGINRVPNPSEMTPEALAWQDKLHTTVSFVFKEKKYDPEKGKEKLFRVIAKAEKIRELGDQDKLMADYYASPEGLAQLKQDSSWRNCDWMFLPGSLLITAPELYHDLLKSAIQTRKRQEEEASEHHLTLYVPLPTSKLKNKNNNHAYLQEAIREADVILTNEEELGLASDIIMQGILRHGMGRPKRWFISRGEAGATMLDHNGTRHDVPTVLNEDELVDALGAGDNSYAGVIAGLEAGLNPKQAAHIGMHLAAECCKQDAAQLPDDKLFATFLNAVNSKEVQEAGKTQQPTAAVDAGSAMPGDPVDKARYAPAIAA